MRPAPLRRAAASKVARAAWQIRKPFSRFSAGEGGSVQANLDRWSAQFTSPPNSQPQTKKGPEGSLTLIRYEGTLRGGTPGGPTQNLSQALLLGAILEAPGELIIMKLAGPARAIATAEKDFVQLASDAVGLTP